MEFKGQKGFSLVELMIVVAILAILGAIAIPSFQRFAINSDLKSAARAIQGDFFLCKESSIAENTQYRMTFNVGTNNYTIEQPPGATIRTKTPADFRNDITIDGIGTTVTQYTFQPRGTVTNGQLRLINGLGSTATITINITGKTSVQFNMQ